VLPDSVSREQFGLWEAEQDSSNYPARDLLNAVRGTLDARSAPCF